MRRVALTFTGMNGKRNEVVVVYSAQGLSERQIRLNDLIAAQAATDAAIQMEKSA